MRSILTFLSIAVLNLASFAQDLDYTIGFVTTGSGEVVIRDVEISENGNVYTVGSFLNNITVYDNPQLQGPPTFYTTNAHYDAFISKHDSLGNLINFTPFVSNKYNDFQSVAVDANENVFIAAEYVGALDVDPSGNLVFITSSDYNMAQPSNVSNTALIKLDASLNYVGHVNLADTVSDPTYIESIRPDGIVVNSQGEVFISGVLPFGSNTAIDADPSSNDFFLSAPGHTNLFMIKYDNNLNLVDGGLIGINGGDGADIGEMKLDDNDNVYLAFRSNSYSFDMDLGLGAADTTFIWTTSYFGAVAKYDENLEYQWSTFTYGGSGPDDEFFFGTAIDTDGTVYVAGANEGECSINGVTIPGPTGGQYDAFLLQIDPSGSLTNVATFKGDQENRLYGIAIAGDKLLVTGGQGWDSEFNYGFNGTDWDSTLAIPETMPNSLNGMIFKLDKNTLRPENVLKYTSSGNFVSVNRGAEVFQNKFFCGARVQGDVDLDPDPNVTIDFASVGTGYKGMVQRFDISDLLNSGGGSTNSLVDAENNTIEVYPNPSAGVVSVQNSATEQEICIVDCLGKVQLKTSIPSGFSSIDFSHCADGTYFLQIDGRTVEKLIKQ